jgi:hypothetical protein
MSFMKKDVNDQSLDARLLFGSWISLSGDHDQLVEFAIFARGTLGQVLQSHFIINARRDPRTRDLAHDCEGTP